MNSSTWTPSSSAPLPPPSRRIVDAPTRVFHWLLALSFAGAYLTAEGERWRLVHVTLGYSLAGLLGWRVLWGLLGPRHSRLAVLGRKLQGLPAWGRAALTGQVQWRQGQNLALALSVALLLGLIAPLALSGYGVYNDWSGEWLEELHEWLGNGLLALVLGHVALVLGISMVRRQNLARPMLTGRVEGAGPDVARHNHRVWALLLLLAVLGFWGYQWQQAPQGAAPAAGQAERPGPGHDED